MQTLSRSSFIRTLTSLAAVAFVSLAAAQGPRDVTPINPPQPTPNDGTIEVMEFFDYGCIHCANLEPALEAWVAKLPPDVKFKRAPAGFNSGGIDSIPIFYTLEAMGKLDSLHKKLFAAVFNERVMLGNKATLLKWLEKQGVDPKQYESVEKSFSVDSKIKRGRQLPGLYKASSTPVIAVNGRFIAVQTSSASNFLGTVDRLIAEARQSNAPAKPATAKVAAPKEPAPK